MKKMFLMLIFLLSWSICLAAMPHVLKNGDIVDANQLNENFQYLELTKADASVTYPTYANGILIGNSTISYISYEIRLTFNSDFFPIGLSKTGEIENINLEHVIGSRGDPSAIYFTEFDCTGDRYVIFSDDPYFLERKNFFFGYPKGRIYKEPSGKLYYYPPKIQTMHARIPLSSYSYDIESCQNHEPPSGYYWTDIESGHIVARTSMPQDNPNWRESTQEEIDIYLTRIMIKLLPNDPAITGLPNTPFPTPITFDGIQEATIDTP